MQRFAQKISLVSLFVMTFGLPQWVDAQDGEIPNEAGEVVLEDQDWRKMGSQEEKVEELVQLIPGVSYWMLRMEIHYQTLYWAAKEEKWDFARYQRKKLWRLAKSMARSKPKDSEEILAFRDLYLDPLGDAVKTADWNQFEIAFDAVADQCNACHVSEGKDFIEIPRVPPKPNSTVLGYPAQ